MDTIRHRPSEKYYADYTNFNIVIHFTSWTELHLKAFTLAAAAAAAISASLFSRFFLSCSLF